MSYDTTLPNSAWSSTRKLEYSTRSFFIQLETTRARWLKTRVELDIRIWRVSDAQKKITKSQKVTTDNKLHKNNGYESNSSNFSPFCFFLSKIFWNSLINTRILESTRTLKLDSSISSTRSILDQNDFEIHTRSPSILENLLLDRALILPNHLNLRCW